MSITVRVSDPTLARMLYLEAKRHGLEKSEAQIVFLDPLAERMPAQTEDTWIIGITYHPEKVAAPIARALFALLSLPFSADELEHVILRLREGGALRVERVDDLLYLNGKRIALSHTEAGLFDLLYENRHRPVTEAEMIALLGESATKTNAVAVYLHRLRRKLGDAGRFVVSLRGVGAQWKERGQTV